MNEADGEIFEVFSTLLKQKEPPQEAPEIFQGDRAKVLAGLAVYRNNVRASLSRVLGDKFPVLKQLVGEEFFRFLAHEYFHAHPPSSPMVTDYGDALPDFLERFAPVAAYPYLPDMARLEIAWLGAYHASEAEIMAPVEIMEAAGEDIARLRVILHPSVQLLASDYPIVSIWQRHQGDGAGENKSALDKAECALIARPYKDVSIRVLTEGAYIALEALSTGQCLEDALGKAAGLDKAFDSQVFFQALFEFQIIAAVRQ